MASGLVRTTPSARLATETCSGVRISLTPMFVVGLGKGLALGQPRKGAASLADPSGRARGPSQARGRFAQHNEEHLRQGHGC